MRMQRSGVPLLILAGVTLVAAVVVVYLIANPFAPDRARDTVPVPHDATSSPAPQVDKPTDKPAGSATAEPAPATAVQTAEPQPAPSPSASAQTGDQTAIPASSYRVRTGDSLFDIAGAVWADPYLWPLILAANDDAITDPDYLRPGERIAIPAWVTLDSGLTDDQRRQLSDAHVVAFEHYRSLGAKAIGLGMGQPQWWLDRLGRARLNKSIWVLYSGLRYDPQLLSEFGSRIRAPDAAQVQGFVDRYGLPPNRR